MNSQKRRHWKAEEKLQIQAFGKILSKKRRRGSSKDRQHSKRSMPAIRDRHSSVLCVGETCPSRSVGGFTEREERAEGVKAGRNAKVTGGETSRSNSRTEHGESGAKKGAFGIAPYRHYSSEEKELILASVERVQQMIGGSVKAILDRLGLGETVPPTPNNTYSYVSQSFATDYSSSNPINN